MLGRNPGAGGANIGSGPSMSIWSGLNTLPHLGKLAAAGLVSIVLAGAASTPRVVAQVRADFNGDGKVDTAVLESTTQSWRIVARFAGLGAKGVVVVNKGQGSAEGLTIARAEPGRYTPMCEEEDERRCPKAIRVRNPAIAFSSEGASQVLYWDGQRFRVIQQGD